MRGGVDFSSSISRRTRGQRDEYFRNLHEELKKSRLEAACSSGVSNVASDVKVDCGGNGEKQDSVVDSSKTVSSAEVDLSISGDDSDSSGESVLLGDDSEISEEDSDDSFDVVEDSDECNTSSNRKRARITAEVQVSVKKGSATEIYNLSSDEEESLERNKYKQKTAAKGKRQKLERQKLGRPPKTRKVSRDDKDNDDEFTLRTAGRPAKKKACGKNNNDVIEQLVDSIWKKDLVDKAPVLVKRTAPYPSTLPLKFRFDDDEPSVPEKTESEKEIDSLIREMEIAMWEPDAGCTNSPMAETEGSCSGNSNSSTCCDQEDVTLDEQIGVICNICSRVLVHIKDIIPPMFVERYGKKGSKELPASPRKEFTFKPSASNNNTAEPCVYSEETVLDLIPDSEKTVLYPHQLEGFKFMWKNIAGDTHIKNLLNLPADQGGGCIISHDPGTGKTRLSIVFIQTFMKLYPDCHPMIIAPPGMLLTWEEEFQKWNVNIKFINLKDSQLNSLEAEAAETVVGKDCGHCQDADYVRCVKLHSWTEGGSVLGVSYKLFEQLAGENKKKPPNKNFRKILLEKPGLLLLDEGHSARNDQTLKWKALTMVKTQRRVILSGTLFQNNFEELYNTLSLVHPRFPLEFESVKKKRGRRKHNEWEISKTTAEKDQVMKLQMVMKQFVHVHKGDILQKTLKGMKECVILLRPTDLQKKLLESITNLCKSKFLIRAYLANLVSIHPFNAALPSSTKKNPDFLNYKNKLAEIKLNVNAGVKTRFLIELIKLAERSGEKVLVFCENIDPLNHITKLLMSQFSSWNKGQEIIHMDGCITGKKRQECIKMFNDKTSKAKVLLASQRACSEGISLVGASRVVMLDVVWNPSVKKQAISRAYRLGQERMVYVYHLVTYMDELLNSELKKYVRQAEKERISELLFSQERPSGDSNNNVVVEDELLERIATHPSLKGIFGDIVHQPKESDFLDRFGSSFSRHDIKSLINQDCPMME